MLHLLPFLLIATPASAGPFAEIEADIYVLGEVHDNAAHHMTQAEAVSDIAPAAVVFEMLTEMQASEVRGGRPTDAETLAEVLQWSKSGWPDFSMYYPIFAAARGAEIFGAAVPRDVSQAAMQDGLAESFAGDAEIFSLKEPLGDDELEERLALQHEAHCGALPEELLPAMVDVQRLRDATLAQSAIEAHRATGGPVAIITGNGHARNDWGVPFYIARAAPELSVVTLGQSEDGLEPDGGFDIILDAPAALREDPCAAFQ
ncbi:ChaN family lipoprotein [Maritimibacter dapengensis]|uniref:ChaN family lipoprotein n=1 Tax=Maritimibacter dapengensis TaxID=2836868 RepID=A0ABS6T604_9RHOB|nr:ChaN family lipoprotein [Maritimibacter dapengensis]MBV7380663.1 ChaN family lipoprotein [Maritimibacter dapengensis]